MPKLKPKPKFLQQVLAGRLGGRARARKLSPSRRSDICRHAARVRWTGEIFTKLDRVLVEPRSPLIGRRFTVPYANAPQHGVVLGSAGPGSYLVRFDGADADVIVRHSQMQQGDWAFEPGECPR